MINDCHNSLSAARVASGMGLAMHRRPSICVHSPAAMASVSARFCNLPSKALSRRLVPGLRTHTASPVRCLSRTAQATPELGAVVQEQQSELPLENLTMDVSGAASEVLRIPAAVQGSPKLQVLLVPGNPGSARYYTEHMRRLHSALDGEAEVLCISHAGHAPHLADGPGNALQSIQDQIRHKADFMRQHLLLPGRPPLVVAGHSIGAFVAVNAVHDVEKARTNPPIIKVFALMGFFSINPESWEIGVHRAVASVYELMGGVAHVLTLVPASMRQSVIKYFSGGGMDKDAEELTEQLLKYNSVRNNFYMAHTEYKLLDQPPPWPVLQSLGDRLHVLGCPNDYWLSRPQFEELVRQLPQMQSSWLEDVGHAYCTSQEQCVRVSAVMKESLSQLQRSG